MGFCRTESVKAALMETTATTNHFLLTFLEVLYEALRMLNFFDYRVTDLFCCLHQTEYSIYIKHYSTKKDRTKYI